MIAERDRTVAGRDLRYVLTSYLVDHGPLTVGCLVALLDRDGLVVAGRASKVVSDALRWEIARGRVARIGRARYAPLPIPRSTARRIRLRVRALTA